MSKFVKVATTDEMANQLAKHLAMDGEKIALFKAGGAFYALSDTCTHRRGPLSEGDVEGTDVTCPWHGAKFDLRTRPALGPPAQTGANDYPVKPAGRDIEIEI